MKHQTKKVIAREFIVLILTLVITLLAFLGTAVYNAFLNSKITPLRESFNENVKQADSLARSYNSKLQNQQWFYNTLDIYFNLPKSRYKSYDIVWKRFQEISSSDSIEYTY
jgi:hypothetical protein